MPNPEPPSVYDIVEALAKRTAERRQTIPHASVDEIAEVLADAGADDVQAALNEAIQRGFIKQHPAYKDMYYVTDEGEAFRDAAAFNS
jgi:hypothetical protein